MDADPSDSLTLLIERARAAMAGHAEPESSGPFVGETGEGMVRAEVDTEGRLTSLAVDAKMLRQPLADICAFIVAAVNLALDERPARAGTGPLLEELKAVQEQSVQEMTKITQAFSSALARALPN